MRNAMIGNFEVSTNGITVWVNGPEGMCLGRYKSGMMDVHNDYAAQVAGEPQCLDCKHGDVTWNDFVAAMSKHHGIDIPDDFKPEGK